MNSKLIKTEVFEYLKHKNAFICKTVQKLFFSFCFLISLNAWAQQDCPTGNPLEWDWIQNIISNEAGCELGEISQFEYDGNMYYVTAPLYDNSYPSYIYSCNPMDTYETKYYDCNGIFLCEGSIASEGDPESCATEIREAAANGSSIWTFEDLYVGGESFHSIIDVKGCPGEVFEFNAGLLGQEDAYYCSPAGQQIGLDPSTNEPIITNLNQEAGCVISFTFNGEGEFIYSLESPYYNSATVDCIFNLSYKENCDPDSPCLANTPLEMDWIQTLINSNDGCEAGEIFQFEYEGSVYFRVDPGEVENDTPCDSNAASKFYSCDGELVCEYGFLSIDDPNRCNNRLVSASFGNAPIWTNEDSFIAEVCPEGDPLLWPWIQTLIESSAGCNVGKIQIVEDSRNTYILTLPGVNENGVPCATEESYTRYTCNGDLVCKLSLFPPPGDTFDCKNQLLSASGTPTTIWTYEDNPVPVTCPEGDPLQWDWVQNLTDDSDGCFVERIDQFEKNGNTYFLIYPTVSVSGIPCSSVDQTFKYVDCNGDLICEYGSIATFIDDSNKCDETQLSFFEDSDITTIWAYEDSLALEGCPAGRPVTWDWIQNLIQKSTRCDVGEIRQFEYNGATYFHAVPGSIENGVPCASDYPHKYYTCQGEYLCEFGLLPIGDPRSCDAGIFSADDDYTSIWTYEDCQLDGDPLEWDWIQALVENTDGCPITEIVKIENNGNTYFSIGSTETENGIPCNSDKIQKNYTCNGEYLCTFRGNLEPGDFDNCYSFEEMYPTASYSSTTIWTFEENPYGYTGGPTPPVDNGGGAPPANPPYDCDDAVLCSFIADYPWLNTLINFDNCTNETVTLYDAGSYNFIQIKGASGSNLYYQDGTYYCSDAPNYDCAMLYGLNTVADSWSCESILNDNLGCTDPLACNYDPLANISDNSCIYEDCENNVKVFEDYTWLNNLVNQSTCSNETITVYGAGSYNFVHIQNGSEGDLYLQDGTFYCSDAPNYDCVMLYGLSSILANWTCGTTLSGISGCTDSSANNYNPTATIDDGSCEYTQTSNAVFNDYPWLSTLVSQNNCSGETITVYDAGGYNFIQIKSSTSSDLYYQNGTYYCSDAPNYNCVTLYGLTTVAGSWTCGDTVSAPCEYENPLTDLDWLADLIYTFRNWPVSVSTYLYNDEIIFKFDDSPSDGNITYYYCDGRSICLLNPFGNINTCADFQATFVEEIYNSSNAYQIYEFEKYPWLNNTIVKCILQPQVTEYDFGHYAFVYSKSIGGGSLYLNDGTLYCEDTDGQTCLNNYNLTEATTTWVCSDDEFQKFDYIYNICEGESVTLRPDYSLNQVSCICPPCAPVGPPGPPRTEWTPSEICSSSNCYPLTVSPTTTSAYIAVVNSVTIGSTGCYPPGPLPSAGSPTTTNFLVVVEPCTPVKTKPVNQAQKIALPSFKIYPNPASNKVFFDFENEQDENTQITLLDMQGKALQTIVTNKTGSKLEMDVSSYPKGIYLVELKNSKTTTVEKLIIK